MITPEHKAQLDALITETIIPAINEDLLIISDDEDEQGISKEYQNECIEYLIDSLKTVIYIP